MIEKTKLSLWDFFVAMLSGFAIVISALVHCLFKGLILCETILDLPSVLIAVASLLLVILIGLLFEPLANCITKLLTTCPSDYLKSFGFKEWDIDNDSLKEKACQYKPDGITGNTYQYCKNWLHQNARHDTVMPFLAKYGFYRGMFLLFLLNGISVLFIYQYCWVIRIAIAFPLFLLGLIYLQRSSVFYRHMTATVYLQFISLFNDNTRNDT